MGLNDLGLEVRPEKIGRPVQMIASDEVLWLPIGQQIAWDLIPANNTAAIVELADGTQIKPGDKGVEFGTVFVRISGGVNAKKWAPFNSAGDAVANPGINVLERDYVGINNISILLSDKYAGIKGLLAGGLLWSERLKVDGAGQPTLVNLRAAMPALRLTPLQ